MSDLIKTEFPYDRMNLTCLYKNKNIDLIHVGIEDHNLDKVYHSALKFPAFPAERPYIYCSLVTSIDGRIAFPDAAQGPLIASRNYLAKEGSVTDWYTLNLLRASADAIIFGAGTLRNEPDGTGHIYDTSLEASRVKSGRQRIPWNIIPTLDGSDIPFGHKEFTCKEIPVMFYTTPKGVARCVKNSLKPVEVIDSIEKCRQPLLTDKNYIIVTGDTLMDNVQGMNMLKALGLQTLLVESPSLTHLFLQEELLDEMFLNYSCIYLGGDSLTIGQSFKSFDSHLHPHTSLISVYMHSSHYMYFRHKVLYGVREDV